jgi:hypothetical protein
MVHSVKPSNPGKDNPLLDCARTAREMMVQHALANSAP